MNTRETLNINENGHLEIGGCDATTLAAQFGTPLYVMDEEYIRKVASAYLNSVLSCYGDGEIAYASKAFCTVAMFKLINALGLSIDVVSAGEIYVAIKAGFPMERCYFHGNNKTAAELELAVVHGVGVIVAEDFEELSYISALAEKNGKRVRVMLRVNPGIEAHTHESFRPQTSTANLAYNCKALR
jgi:Diaminopimelate decarboxylase